MFYFLILLGSGLILLGIKNGNNQKQNEKCDSFEIDEIKMRLEHLERLVFQGIMENEEKKSNDNAFETKPIPDNIKAIMSYEEKGLSVQEISTITRMNKGEVLLLKNLSKHYAR